MTTRLTMSAAAFLLALSAPALAQTALDDYPADAPVGLEVLHRAVSAGFLDPRSAQYKKISWHTDYASGAVFCGWVNAKNSAGGYTPFYPFFFTTAKETATVAEDYADPILSKLSLMPFDFVGCMKPLGLKFVEQ